MSESIERTLGRIETKVDAVMSGQASLAKRTTSLEKWQSRVLGGAVVAGFMLGVAVKFLS